MKSPLLFVIGLLLSGCNSDTPNISEPPAPGKYAFAVVYENHSWSNSKKGLVITGAGDIYRYDISAVNPTSILHQDKLTEADLSRYFEAAEYRFVEQIAPAQLQNFWSTATKSNSALSEPTSICRDAGVFQYLAFSYDKNSLSYRYIKPATSASSIQTSPFSR
ncbi:hypothetical protein [Rheinheimera sp.]|uniref:hypothetical protein n=1 Tax=Rheinheimera sp. TaxID=1869214 RepID=UPI0027B91BA5|nr:hypothetical protein [Rheinheimera sp.]